MSVVRIKISAGEAGTFRGYLNASEKAARDVEVAATVILARLGIAVATVDGLEGEELVLTVPDAGRREMLRPTMDGPHAHPEFGGVRNLNGAGGE